ELGPEHILRRVNKYEVQPYSELFQFLEPGVLLDGRAELPVFKKYWAQARADSFGAPEFMLRLRETKLR
ncbi:MAG: FMN-binding glutamate synthase family protein, partial [Pseudomonas neustonica]